MINVDLEGYLRSQFLKIGITLSEKQVNQFLIFKNELQEWNKVMNLTGIADDIGIIDKHFIDSSSLLIAAEIQAHHRVIDVGTGAGFPGVPISIITGCDMTLLDSLQKRLKFIDHVIAAADIKHIQLCHGRAEDIGHLPKYRESYDYVCARAVASLEVLLEYTVPFLKIGGHFVAHKSRQADFEVEKAETAIKTLGCKLISVKPLELFDGEERNMIIIQKIKSTPKMYPRKAGIPTKMPIGSA